MSNEPCMNREAVYSCICHAMMGDCLFYYVLDKGKTDLSIVNKLEMNLWLALSMSVHDPLE